MRAAVVWSVLCGLASQAATPACTTLTGDTPSSSCDETCDYLGATF